MENKSLFLTVQTCNRCLILIYRNFKKAKRKIFLNIRIPKLNIDICKIYNIKLIKSLCFIVNIILITHNILLFIIQKNS